MKPRNFALWKENRFFSSKKKTITKTVAAALLKEGSAFPCPGFSVRKPAKTYDAMVVLDDTGEKYVNFKLEFPQQRGTEEMTGPPRELTRSERAAIRRLVTGLCANYDEREKLCLPLDCSCYMLHKWVDRLPLPVF